MTIFAVVFLMAVIIAASLILILITSRREQNKIEKMQNAFNEAVAEFNLSVSKQDLLGNRIIGLDEENRNLLFFNTTGRKHDGYIIDLDEIKAVTIKKEYGLTFASYTRRIGAKTVVSNIALELTYKNGAKPLVLSFYDKEIDPEFDIQHRAEQTKKWQELVSGLLTRSNETRKLKRSDNRYIGVM